MSGFIGDLEVLLVTDEENELWELMQPLGFESAVAGMTITAPAGTQTDFCSVPRVPGVYDMLGNRARRAGTIHDYLYQSHLVDRATADAVLKEMLLENDVDEVTADAFYLAVRCFGGSHW